MAFSVTNYNIVATDCCTKEIVDNTELISYQKCALAVAVNKV